MAVSALPLLLSGLYDAAQAAMPGVNVYYGSGVSDDPGDYLMVGVEDPDSTAFMNAASSTQDWASMGAYSRNEEGDLNCAALSWTGDAGSEAQRDVVASAFDIVEATAALCKRGDDLGVETVLWSSALTSTELTTMQADSGSLAMVMFTVHYKARI